MEYTVSCQSGRNDLTDLVNVLSIKVCGIFMDYYLCYQRKMMPRLRNHQNILCRKKERLEKFAKMMGVFYCSNSMGEVVPRCSARV